jgi:hypothetical protein
MQKQQEVRLKDKSFNLRVLFFSCRLNLLTKITKLRKE